MAPAMCEPLVKFSDRLYFTTFPHPPPPMSILNLPEPSTSAPRIRSRSKGELGAPASPEDSDAQYHYFTVDDELVYMSFYEDWGPLNIAMVYRACIFIHDLLHDEALSSHRFVLYSSDDPRRKANAALLMALFVLIVQQRAPWEAFHPIAELEFMPFRDAGRGRSDFNLSIQDCLWGFWKAQRHKLIDMNQFNVEEYEFYEKVENGDWNWITPGFIAFASPIDQMWIRSHNAATAKPATSLEDSPKASPSLFRETALKRKLPQPFLNCLEYFEKEKVKLVVRLNNPLYDKGTFEERGFEHLELYFDDGTNPTDEIVREFIRKSDQVIENGGVVAVHCKAGLGRTGTLIGAYLVYKYNFTANEAIAFMRIARPGCVVGPQQQYLYQRQLDWAKWAAVDELQKAQAASALAAQASRAVTPPTETEDISLSDGDGPPVTPPRPSIASTPSAIEVEGLLPPGQPRKTPSGKRIAVDIGSEEDEDGEDMELTPRGKRQAAKEPPRGRTMAIKPRRSITRPPASDRKTRASTRSLAANSAATAREAVAIVQQASTSAASMSAAAGYKIPRLAAMTASKIPARRATRPASPSPTPVRSSRLPTLIPSKRSYAVKTPATATTTSINVSITVDTASPAPDTWMLGPEPKVPGGKKERPLLRSVRRRRSSFSSADVVI